MKPVIAASFLPGMHFLIFGLVHQAGFGSGWNAWRFWFWWEQGYWKLWCQFLQLHRRWSVFWNPWWDQFRCRCSSWEAADLCWYPQKMMATYLLAKNISTEWHLMERFNDEIDLASNWPFACWPNDRGIAVLTKQCVRMMSVGQTFFNQKTYNPHSSLLASQLCWFWNI